jgi:DNA polymerase-3 subunit delta
MKKRWLFVLLTGGDTRQITNELEKIDLYLGADRTVTVEQVRTLVPLSRAGVIFELGNALAASDLNRALKLVRGLLDQGESAIGILLVAIVPTIRNLLLARDLMQRHRLARPAAPFSFISALNRLPESATEHCPARKTSTSMGSRSASPRRTHTDSRSAVNCRTGKRVCKRTCSWSARS